MTADCRLNSISKSDDTDMNNDKVSELASCQLPINGLGIFALKVFSYTKEPNLEHLALIKAPVKANDLPSIPLVRVHSECLTGDVFGSMRCDCGSQLTLSMQSIADKGGALLYMRQEGRGIGLVNKIKAYQLQQEEDLDTVQANQTLGLPADGRDYLVSALILKYLNMSTIELITNNPKKVEGLTKYGIKVKARLPIITEPNEQNSRYLSTKKDKLGHLLSILSEN
jgi:3,4-dihydroxy 2-butanone 4-phosphate synthase/GTP cyclohydrolase II